MPNIKLVDAFTDFVEESTLPYRQMMTYYNCALMEVCLLYTSPSPRD